MTRRWSRQVLRRIQEEARRRHAIFVKIDPDVRADSRHRASGAVAAGPAWLAGLR